MNNKLQKLAPGWHAEAIGILKENFTAVHEAFLDSTKKAVWMGLFLNFIKQRGKEDGSIPHGEFLPWLAKNFPDAPERTLRTYMKLAVDVSEKGKFGIGHFSQFAHCGELPESIQKLIEGKTQNQLILEFRAEKQPAEYHPREPMTPEEKQAARRQAAVDLMGLCCAPMTTLMINPQPTLAELTKAERRQFLDMLVTVSNEIRKFKA